MKTKFTTTIMAAFAALTLLCSCEKEMTQEDRIKKINSQIEELTDKVNRKQLTKSDYEDYVKGINKDLAKLANNNAYNQQVLQKLDLLTTILLQKENQKKLTQEEIENYKLPDPKPYGLSQKTFGADL